MTVRVDAQAAKERAENIIGAPFDATEAQLARDVLALVGLLADAELERDGAKRRADAMQEEADYHLRENERLSGLLADAKKELARLYDDVDEAQRLDNTGGDSAVSVVLWSWAEHLAAFDAAGGAGDG